MANFNINKVILGGRLTADPELKQTQSGVSVCTFSIAVNRRFTANNSANNQPAADFFNCTAWRATGEFVNKHFGKGASICVAGSIQNRSWTDQNGQKRYATDIIVDEAYFVDSKAEAPSGDTYVPDAYTNPQPVMEEIKTDDDLPF
jgi:single-strand DNA-binding protein